MSIVDTKPTFAVQYVATESDTGTSGRLVDGQDIGCYIPRRIVSVFRVGKEFMCVARVRIVQSTDFCGGAQMSSVYVKIARPSDWDTDIRLESPFRVEGDEWQFRVSFDDTCKLFNSIPDVADRFKDPTYKDVEEFAYITLAHAVSTFCQYNGRNGLIYQDRKEGKVSRLAKDVSELKIGFNNLFQAPSTITKEIYSSYGLLNTHKKAWVMHEVEQRETVFYNRNSQNMVVSGIVVNAGGVHVEDAGDDYPCEEEYYDEEIDDYRSPEYCECARCCPMHEEDFPTTDARLHMPPEVHTFYNSNANCFLPRFYWNCG